MAAVRVSRDLRAAIVGSPAYFESHPKPASPRELLSHRCINFRHRPDEVYRWEFDKGKRSLAIAVNGPLIVDDAELSLRAALDGVGPVSVMIRTPRPRVDSAPFALVPYSVTCSGSNS